MLRRGPSIYLLTAPPRTFDLLKHPMPTYQYRCQTCSTELEVWQSFSEEPLTECPEGCGAGSLRKVFSGVGISFRGSGFYKNDHGSSSGERTSTDQKGPANASGETTGVETPGGNSGKKPNGDNSTGTKPAGEKASSTTNPSKASQSD